MACIGNKGPTICFDLRYLQRAYRNSPYGALGGPGIYGRELWKAFAHLFPATKFVALVDHGFLPKKFHELIRLAPRHEIIPFGLTGRSTILSRLAQSRLAWTISALECQLQLGMPKEPPRFDILHVLDQAPTPFVELCPTVITIHDLVPLGAGGLHPSSNLLEKMHRRFLMSSWSKVDHLICDSKSTVNDLNVSLKGSKARTQIVYPGIKLDIFKPGSTKKQELRKKFGISKDYFMHVGVCTGRKNPYKLIEAISLVVKNSRKDFLFVFIGPYQVNKEAKALIERLATNYGIADRIMNVGDVTDLDLATLYRNALALVFPSLYEGFGFPALECLACGTQSIVSNTSSLPEIVGDLGILVDPTDARQIAEAMIRILESGKSPMLFHEGPRWAQKFSWDDAAVACMKIYKDLF